MKTRSVSLTVLLDKEQKICSYNCRLVIFLDIVMKLPFSPDLSICVRLISEKKQKKNKNENFAEYTKRGNMITAWVKESGNKFQSTLRGEKL